MRLIADQQQRARVALLAQRFGDLHAGLAGADDENRSWHAGRLALSAPKRDFAHRSAASAPGRAGRRGAAGDARHSSPRARLTQITDWAPRTAGGHQKT